MHIVRKKLPRNLQAGEMSPIASESREKAHIQTMPAVAMRVAIVLSLLVVARAFFVPTQVCVLRAPQR